MCENFFFNIWVVQVFNFLEAGDEENPQIVVIALHDVLDEILFEPAKVSSEV